MKLNISNYEMAIKSRDDLIESLQKEIEELKERIEELKNKSVQDEFELTVKGDIQPIRKTSDGWTR
jgi:FtsZ-binding cell division protein ZapB